MQRMPSADGSNTLLSQLNHQGLFSLPDGAVKPFGKRLFLSYMPREPLTTLHAKSLLGLSVIILCNLENLILLGRLGLSISLSIVRC